MTDSVALQVRAIKAAQAARDGLWIVAVRARLREGPATSRELFDGVFQPVRGAFLVRLYAMEKAGLIECATPVRRPTGHLSKTWRLPVCSTLHLATIVAQHHAGVAT
ncbi:MAG: hypothetical protein K9G48_15445 [Reyranella sp.]|nr:hypothetical protein [Reyranella sp.]